VTTSRKYPPEFTNALNAIRSQWGLWFFFCEWERLGRPELLGDETELSFIGDSAVFNIRLHS
jgi:hypothetical protein